MSKKIYYSFDDSGEFAFSNANIAQWYFNKMGHDDYDGHDISLDNEEIIEQYYIESLSEQKERLLDLLKERPEATKKMIDEVLDEMYKRK